MITSIKQTNKNKSCVKLIFALLGDRFKNSSSVRKSKF